MMKFICSNCGKEFEMPEIAGKIMEKCPEKACSPKCGLELLKKNPHGALINDVSIRQN